MTSREVMEDAPITTIYEIEYGNGDIRYFTADELTLIAAFQYSRREFSVKTLTYTQYLDKIYKTAE